MNRARKSRHTYFVKLTPDEDGGFIAEVPRLPGCVTWGETEDDALEMVVDAIAGYLAVLSQDKRDIPTDDETVCVDMVGTDEAKVKRLELPDTKRGFVSV